MSRINDLRFQGFSHFIPAFHTSTAACDRLEAQAAAIAEQVAKRGGKVIADFEEVQTGKGSDALDRRPVLAEALRMAKARRAVLIVSRLDRLSRNLHFVSGLIDKGADIAVADMPQADKRMLQVFAMVGEWERDAIASRIKAALQAKKARRATTPCTSRLKGNYMRMGWGVGMNDVQAVLRALPSLAPRYAAQDAAGRTLSMWWQQQPQVSRVLHPALPGPHQVTPIGRRCAARPSACSRWSSMSATSTTMSIHAFVDVSQKALIQAKAPCAKDFTNQRPRKGGHIDEAVRAKNRTKSQVRARVEHVFGVVKRLWGFNKVRYRGLAKNATRSFVALALANIFLARRTLYGRVRPWRTQRGPMLAARPKRTRPAAQWASHPR